MSPPSEHELAIAGELTIYRALELKQQLIEALAASEALRLDLAGVSDADSAGVQLLLAARRAAAAAGKSLRLARPSPAVRDVFALLNLGAMLDEHALGTGSPS